VFAQPVHGEPGAEDPTEILRVLPEEFHEQFRAEYTAAVEHARDPGGYRGLTEVLRLWRLRAAAYSDPGYARRLAAARTEGCTDDVPAERVIGSWPRR
jgi:Family of unknown function (DUF6247)